MAGLAPPSFDVLLIEHHGKIRLSRPGSGPSLGQSWSIPLDFGEYSVKAARRDFDGQGFWIALMDKSTAGVWLVHAKLDGGVVRVYENKVVSSDEDRRKLTAIPYSLSLTNGPHLLHFFSNDVPLIDDSTVASATGYLMYGPPNGAIKISKKVDGQWKETILKKYSKGLPASIESLKNYLVVRSYNGLVSVFSKDRDPKEFRSIKVDKPF